MPAAHEPDAPMRHPYRQTMAAAPARYAGPSRQQRVMTATGVVLGFVALMWAFGRIGDLPPPPRPVERALTLFTVPPPPSPPPPVPEPHRVPQRTASAQTPLAGGSIGHRRRTPMPVVHDPARMLLERPIAPVADIDAPPIPEGRNAAAGLSTGGMDGLGIGTGSGGGSGDGIGVGSGGGSMHYARAIWVVPPGLADFRREWPRAAPRLKVAVHVFLVCPVKPNGRPFDCRTLIESQPGLGFAAAAIRLAERARVRPVLVDGKRSDLPVIVPLSFLPL